VNFEPEGLGFGSERRNLVTLQTLNRLRLIVRKWKGSRRGVRNAGIEPVAVP
jgi:hypothetical protein